MTKQEYYELLVACAGDGRFPSAQQGECRYRADETASCPRRCAWGLLIPDGVYHKEMEFMGTFRLWEQNVFIRPEGLTFEDILNIQHLHDESAGDWRAEDFLEQLNALPCFQDVESLA
jgi:hypothetical protein